MQTIWLRLATTFYATITPCIVLYYLYSQHTRDSYLPYHSIFYVGIVQTDGQQGSNHPAKNTTMVEPFAGSSGMDFLFPAAPLR
jgi:hypothetical protein